MHEFGMWCARHRSLLIIALGVLFVCMFFWVCVLFVIPSSAFNFKPIYVMGLMFLVCLAMFLGSFLVHEDDDAPWITRGQRKY